MAPKKSGDVPASKDNKKKASASAKPKPAGSKVVGKTSTTKAPEKKDLKKKL